ncbi:MAG: thioredoxin fold domain-containing protein [Alphaproteobacteria bacterium]
MTTTNSVKRKLLTFIAACTIMGSGASIAQDNTLLPELPAPLKNLVNEGAQVRFLGKDFDVEGWVAIKNGKEQYFYVLPNNGGFISGILFNEKGQAVTIKQVSRLRAQSGGELLDTLAEDAPGKVTDTAKTQKYEFKTPSEQLFWDIENSNWIPVGQAGTPVFYSFVDPQCPHCHEMMRTMKPQIDAGRVQVRLIPVGFKEETRAQAAFLLATPAPSQVWWRHLEGDRNALPAKQEINQQGVQRNLSIMQSWKLNVTPLIVYRGKDDKVKIIRGKVKDIEALISDLGART